MTPLGAPAFEQLRVTRFRMPKVAMALWGCLWMAGVIGAVEEAAQAETKECGNV